MTFEQFLDEKEKRVKLYGLGSKGFSTGSSSVSVVNPARPAKPVYTGLNVSQIFPVPRVGKRKQGVMAR